MTSTTFLSFYNSLKSPVKEEVVVSKFYFKCGIKEEVELPGEIPAEDIEQRTHTKASQEGASGPFRALEARINGVHGRDSLEYKAAVDEQLSEALGKSGVDLLSQQFLGQAGQTGQRLAEQACALFSSACGHKFGLIPTFRPLKESSEEIHEQVMAALAATELGEPVNLVVRAEDNKPPQSDHSTQALIDRFLEAKKRSLHPASITSYGAALRPFARAYPQLPVKPESIEAYLDNFSNETTTARDNFNVLRAFYNWLGRRDGLPVNPMKMVEKPAGQADETLPLNEGQARVLHDEPKTDREQAYVGLMLDHGFRLSEVIRLNVGDIHEDRIWVHGKERKQWFPLLWEVRDWLLKLADGRAADQPLFSGRQGRLSDSQVQLDIKRLLERAGINGIRQSPHTLRHTFSTLAYLAGCDWDAVELLLRQREKKRSVTNRYIHLSPEPRLKLVREKLEMYSPLRILGPGPQLGIKPDYAQLDVTLDPAQQLPDLLDRMIALGDMAQEIKHSLGGNGRWPEQIGEIIRSLEHQAQK